MTALDRARKAVLIIEQNAIDREGLAVILRRAGYPVVAVGSPQAGLEALSGGETALILLDATRPDDVREFLQRCRGDQAVGRVPVVLTADTPDASPLAQAFGVSVCLPKPFDEEALLGEVRRHLG